MTPVTTRKPLTDAEVISAIYGAKYTPAAVQRMHKAGKIRRHSVPFLLARRWGIK